MKVAVLYLDEGSLEETYPKDFEGRDESPMRQPIASALKELGHIVTFVNMDLDAFDKLRKMDVDVAFNLCDDGFHSQAWMEPHVAAMLDVLKIPYTGSGHDALTMCLDKAHTKKILYYHGLPTPEFYVAENEDDLDNDLNYPVIVKPSREDGSIGIKYDSVAKDKKSLHKLVARVIETYNQPALVEEYVDGREFNVALLGNGKPKPLPISEIKFGGMAKNQQIVSYKAKWVENSNQYKGTIPECPAKINHELSDNLKEIAREAYHLMGVKGYGRVDFRVNEDGPWILEVNPNPDIGPDAGVARSAKVGGLTYEKLVESIIEYALEDVRWT
ncbi:MAG: ATP-grasp domain-containing protein [Methanobacteriota archaeon]